MNRTIRSQAGYSLAEMLTVVAIIGVLALVMVPNFMSFYQSNKMKSSMRNFTTDLRSTRQLAITQGRQAALSFKTGSNERSYDMYLGDKPFASKTWTAQTGPGRNRPTKILDDIAYFPANGASTPQTFTDADGDIDCSLSPCVTICSTCPPPPPPPPPGAPDGKLDVIFFPDGRVKLPANATSGTITIKTDLNKLPKPQYTITISPSGRVQVQ
ncbi:MAG TPA: prepilin-type N-terminal cleavage/methylation domain-containing protein [Thermoanaerobaculia bacterium]|jgi:prepilin-type N-terminal cleavage/methylation domain-containing protein